MIKSMTGFGHATYDNGQVQMHIEIKSLNSKFLDLNLRLPKVFSDHEIEIRNLISERLERGKVSVALDYQRHGDAAIKQTYNENLFAAYYNELKKLADRVGAPHDPLFQLALSSPEVIQSSLKEDLYEDEWVTVRKYVDEAIHKCEQFRIAEGLVLEKMLKACCASIRENLLMIEALDPTRVEKIREKLKGNVESFFGEDGYDKNRLEQEIIFYVEKLDINEEKVRLTAHLDYFIKALEEKQSNGKKLAFISQEIGREINTIGSKANDAHIQKYVVLMKEELEKIKEQLNNVL